MMKADKTLEVIDRYAIIDKLGGGSSSTVYQVFDPYSHREVALKLLPNLYQNKIELAERFEREVHLVDHLDHPHIVTIYDVGVHDGQPFIVMPLLEGGILNERYSDPLFDFGRLVHVLGQVGDALFAAHEKNIVHRDVKPANILFDKLDDAYLADFGIADVVEKADGITKSGLVGTPAYMSPEQFSLDLIDGRSDEYAMAVMVFEALSGQLPFKGSPAQMMHQHLNAPVPNLSIFRPDCPPELNMVLWKAMSKSPSDRYLTILDFVDALRYLIERDSRIGLLPLRVRESAELSFVPPLPSSAPKTDVISGGEPEDLERLYRVGLVALDQKAWRAAYDSFDQIVAVDKSYRNASVLRVKAAAALNEEQRLKSDMPTMVVQYEQFAAEYIDSGTWPQPQNVNPFEKSAPVSKQKPMPKKEKRVRAARRSWLPTALLTILMAAFFAGGLLLAGPSLLKKLDGLAGDASYGEAVLIDKQADDVLDADAPVVAEPVASIVAESDSSAANLTISPNETETEITEQDGQTSPVVSSATPLSLDTAVEPVAEPTPEAATEPVTDATLDETNSDALENGPNPTGGVSFGNGLPLGFRQFDVWFRGADLNGTFTQTSAFAKTGTHSGQLHYDFHTTADDSMLFLQLNQIQGTPNAISAWVYGDLSGHLLNVWIIDAEDVTWQVPLGRVLHQGWKQMTGYINPAQDRPWQRISGPDNDSVTYPIVFRAIMLDDYVDIYEGQGDIYIDDIRGVTIRDNELAIDVSSVSGVTANPLPGAENSKNGLGRVAYLADGNLYTTDPNWTGGYRLGETQANSCHASFAVNNGVTYQATTPAKCEIGKTLNICQSPDGEYAVYVDGREGEGRVILSLYATNEPDKTIMTQSGAIDLDEGIRWSPSGAAFLYVSQDAVKQMTIGGKVSQILPVAYDPIYSPNGSQILFRKPVAAGVNDVFIANADGSNVHNISNDSSVNKQCAVWLR